MRSRQIALAACAATAVFVLGWKTRDLTAQAPKPVSMTRIYTGPDGLSHAEVVPIKLNAGGVGETMKASGAQFSRRPPGPASDWHVGPRRQLVITLSGRAELEVAGGQKVAVGPGHISLIEDTTGKGHTTRNVGPDDRIVVTIPLE